MLSKSFLEEKEPKTEKRMIFLYVKNLQSNKCNPFLTWTGANKIHKWRIVRPEFTKQFRRFQYIVNSCRCMLQIFDIQKREPLQLRHYDENLHLCCYSYIRIMCVVYHSVENVLWIEKERVFRFRFPTGHIGKFNSSHSVLVLLWNIPSFYSHFKCIFLVDLRKNLSSIVGNNILPVPSIKGVLWM